MENPENIIKFTEFEPSSPYSEEKPQEDPYAYPTRSGKEEERPLGFFGRLMGRKSQPTRPAQPVQRPRPQTMISPEMEDPLESEEESIEIPAFLRRQQNR
jgi:hypothetical protein